MATRGPKMSNDVWKGAVWQKIILTKFSNLTWNIHETISIETIHLAFFVILYMDMDRFMLLYVIASLILRFSEEMSFNHFLLNIWWKKLILKVSIGKISTELSVVSSETIEPSPEAVSHCWFLIWKYAWCQDHDHELILLQQIPHILESI